MIFKWSWIFPIRMNCPLILGTKCCLTKNVSYASLSAFAIKSVQNKISNPTLEPFNISWPICQHVRNWEKGACLYNPSTPTRSNGKIAQIYSFLTSMTYQSTREMTTVSMKWDQVSSTYHVFVLNTAPYIGCIHRAKKMTFKHGQNKPWI